MPSTRDLYNTPSPTTSAPRGSTRAMYDPGGIPTPEDEASGAVNAGKAAKSAFNVAAYPAKVLFHELPKLVDASIGAIIQDVRQKPVDTRAAVLHGEGPTAAEALADWQGRGVNEGYIPEGVAGALDAVSPMVPFGSVAQFATSPQGQGLGLNLLAGEALNPIGAATVAAPLRAIGSSRLGNAARGLPGVKQAGNLFSRGFGITDPKVRHGLRDVIDQELGQEALENALLAEETARRTELAKAAAKASGGSAGALEAKVVGALENRTRTGGASTRALYREERPLAASFLRQHRRQPAERKALELEPFELKPEPGEVDYFPRVGTRQMQKAIGESRGAEPPVFRGPRGISTTPGKQRISDPAHTTAEVEQDLARGLPELQGKPAFRPGIEASMIAGQRASRQTANARILRSVVDKFGVDAPNPLRVPKGTKRASDLTSAKTGFESGYTKTLETKALPYEVWNALDDYSRAMSPSTGKGFPHFWDNLNRAWKQTATSVNPRFSIRNAASASVVAYARGNRAPRNFVEAANALGGGNERLLRELQRHRVVGVGFATEGLPSGRLSDEGIGKTILKALPRAGAKVNTQVEDVFRAAFYISRRKAGASEKDAARAVAQTYFNYSKDSFTAFEGKLRRNLIPFYSWQRRILPLTLRTAGERPGAFSQMGQTIASVDEWNGMHPDEVQWLGPDMMQSLGVALPPYPGQKPSERRMLSLSAIPMASDVNAMLGTRGRGVHGPIDNVLSSTTPFLGAPLKLAFKRDVYRNRELNGRPMELPSALRIIPEMFPKLAAKLDMKIVNGRVVGTDFTKEMWNVGGPFPSALSDLNAARIGDKSAQRRAFAWLTSVNESVRDIDEGKRIQAGIAKSKQRKEQDKKRQEGYLRQRFEREDSLNARLYPQELSKP